MPSESLDPEAFATTASGALPVLGVTTSETVGGWLAAPTVNTVLAEPESAFAAVKVTVKEPV